MQLLCEHAEEGTLYPEEVSAYVVAELLSAAEAFSGAPISKAVISVRVRDSSQPLHQACRELLLACMRPACCWLVSQEACMQVPAYFNGEQREATIQAGRLAGLATVRLLRCAPSFKAKSQATPSHINLMEQIACAVPCSKELIMS